MYKRLGTYYMQHIARRDGPLPPLSEILVRGVVDSVIGTFLARILTAVAGFLIARHLGVTLYGQYSTLMSTLALMSGPLGFGLDTWLLREGGRNPATLLRNAQQVVVLKIAGACLLLVPLAVAWNQETVSLALAIGVVGLTFDSFSQTGYAVLRAMRRNRHVAVFQTLSALLLLIAVLAMFNGSPSVLLLMAVQATFSILLTIIIAINIWRSWSTVAGEFNLLTVLKGAWLFVAADILANIYSQSSISILGSSVGDTEAGLLRAALTTISATFIVPLLIFYVGLPLLSAPDLTRQARRSLISLMAIGAALYGIAAIIGVQMIGEAIISIAYGRGYEAALPYVMIMSVVPLFKAGSFVCVAIMLSLNAQLLRVILQSVVVGLSVIGGLMFIPVYSITGAAWLHVAVEALLFSLYFFGTVWALRRVRA